MPRFMKNGVVHIAVTRVTEYIPLDANRIELMTFVASMSEEDCRLNGFQSIEWTPLDFIEWLPSSVPNFHLEWLYGTQGEIL